MHLYPVIRNTDRAENVSLRNRTLCGEGAGDDDLAFRRVPV